eukprot:scaffold7362_cov266-Pinguiococcus_pyrenoidosus.AAC.2
MMYPPSPLPSYGSHGSSSMYRGKASSSRPPQRPRESTQQPPSPTRRQAPDHATRSPHPQCSPSSPAPPSRRRRRLPRSRSGSLRPPAARPLRPRNAHIHLQAVRHNTRQRLHKTAAPRATLYPGAPRADPKGTPARPLRSAEAAQSRSNRSVFAVRPVPETDAGPLDLPAAVRLWRSGPCSTKSRIPAPYLAGR